MSSNLTSSVMKGFRRPPGFVEIVGLPIVGGLLIELLHTPKNELLLLFAPFLIVVVRLCVAQFQIPPANGSPPQPSVRRALRNCVAVNQLAAFVLVLVEAGVVIATSPTAPADVWAVVIGIFAVYVALRCLSRHYWIVASDGMKLALSTTAMSA